MAEEIGQPTSHCETLIDVHEELMRRREALAKESTVLSQRIAHDQHRLSEVGTLLEAHEASADRIGRDRASHQEESKMMSESKMMAEPSQGRPITDNPQA